MFVFKAAVVGAGTMGGEIAQVDRRRRHPRRAQGRRPEVRRPGPGEGPPGHAGPAGRAGRQGEDHPGAGRRPGSRRSLGRIHGTTEYDGFGDVDFVIEAVPEKMEIKQAVFAELDAVTPGHAILASNTSSLSISEMGEATSRPDKVVGFHFFYPASMMRLIEVIEGDDTSPETAQAAANFAQAIRKMPIRCGEVPGLRRQPDPQLGGLRDLARAGGGGASTRGDRQVGRRVQGGARWGRSSSPTCSASTPCCKVAEHLQRVLRRPLLRPQGDAGARRRRQPRARRPGRGSMSTAADIDAQRHSPSASR